MPQGVFLKWDFEELDAELSLFVFVELAVDFFVAFSPEEPFEEVVDVSEVRVFVIMQSQ
jgi:hypothetical protein